MMIYSEDRPLISVKENIGGLGERLKTVLHNSTPARFVISKDKISVGCSDITPEAAKYILQQWEKEFGKETSTIVIQP